MENNSKSNESFRSSFKPYFHRQTLNKLVKNLLVFIPNTERFVYKIRIKIGLINNNLLSRIFRSAKNQSTEYLKLNRIKLLKSQNISHKNYTKYFTNNFNKKLIYKEKLDIDTVLKNQKSLLRQMLKQQKNVLKEETSKIIQEEKKRIRKKYKTKSNKNKML